MGVRMCVHVCVWVCACACMHARVRMGVCMCVWGEGGEGMCAGGACMRASETVCSCAKIFPPSPPHTHDRPVIALGSDFGSTSLPPSHQPFSLSCGLPGKLRWVSTSIVRWDPAQDWPSDLDCALRWNKGLVSYDGAALGLGGPDTQRLLTSPLTMSLGGISSPMALQLTDGLYDAWLGAPSLLPELPPDGRVSLWFSHPVNLALLQAALRLQPGVPGARLRVSTCAGDASGGGALDPGLYLEPEPGLAQLDVNSSCAEVAVVGGTLRGDVGYSLSLPRGSRYHALAGPLGQEAAVSVGGLHPFR